MRKEISIETSVFSENDINAMQAENRLIDAEAKIAIILVDKKRILKELDDLEEKIKLSKQIIDDTNLEIISLNKNILEVKSSLRSEKQSLDEFIKEKDSKKLEIITDIEKYNKDKEEIFSTILELSKKHELNKFAQEQEIKDIEAKKGILIAEISTLTKKEEDFKKNINKLEEVSDKVLSEIETSKEEKKKLDSELINLKNKIEDQELTIGNNKIIVSQLDSIILGKKSDVSVLDIKIEQKSIEYKEIESQAFSILQKHEAVNQREAFLKSQYERAGIKWEEIK